MTLYMMLKHFWKTKEYNDIGQLLLISQDKVVKDKDELSEPNAQLELHINNPRAASCTLKENLASCGYRAETTKNQTGDPVLRLAELQVELLARGLSTGRVPTINSGCLLVTRGHWL